MIENVTALVPTYNESQNIARTLERLDWVAKIVIIDSYSTDDTIRIAQNYSRAEIHQRPFDTFAKQCNYGLTKIETEWVISLDADYVLSKELIAEIRELSFDTNIDGYFARFKYCVFGRALRGSLYPARQVLYRKAKAEYVDEGHGHRVQVQGKSSTLLGYILHDDRKPLTRWLKSQDNYMIIEAETLVKLHYSELNLPDRLRKAKVVTPLIVLFYCLFLKRGILDGWPGCYYAFQRMLAEIILSLRLIELENLSQTTSTAIPQKVGVNALLTGSKIDPVDEKHG